MMDLSEFQALSARAKKITQDADRADGALAQLFKRLEADHGAADEGEAAKKLKAVRKKLEAGKEKFQKELAKVRVEFKDKLEGDNDR